MVIQSVNNETAELVVTAKPSHTSSGFLGIGPHITKNIKVFEYLNIAFLFFTVFTLSTLTMLISSCLWNYVNIWLMLIQTLSGLVTMILYRNKWLTAESRYVYEIASDAALTKRLNQLPGKIK